MKLKNVLKAVSAAAVLATASVSASAGYVVLDGWQLTTPTGTTTDIGRLNLVSGTSTIEQQVNSSGQVFVGASFQETGVIYSISATSENVVGAGDSGVPILLSSGLTLSFTDVVGLITSVNADGSYSYTFTSGSFLLESTVDGTDYASGSIIGLGGTSLSTGVIGGANGDSTLLAQILELLLSTFDISDSTGTSLLADLISGDVLIEAITNNNVTSSSPVAACSYDAALNCITISAASAGDAYLVRDIPEPASIALLGLGLVGLGFARRRKSAI